MTFSDPCCDAERDCIREKCAWWVLQSMNIGGTVHVATGCAVAFIAAKNLRGATINGGESTGEER
uniref:hypothetical protein n=1 Tax=Collinsella bouchesdurhonensis TaxID=1907654 RepID=UPI00359C1726